VGRSSTSLPSVVETSTEVLHPPGDTCMHVQGPCTLSRVKGSLAGVGCVGPAMVARTMLPWGGG